MPLKPQITFSILPYIEVARSTAGHFFPGLGCGREVITRYEISSELQEAEEARGDVDRCASQARADYAMMPIMAYLMMRSSLRSASPIILPRRMPPISASGHRHYRMRHACQCFTLPYPPLSFISANLSRLDVFATLFMQRKLLKAKTYKPSDDDSAGPASARWLPMPIFCCAALCWLRHHGALRALISRPSACPTTRFHYRALSPIKPAPAPPRPPPDVIEAQRA